MKRNLSMPAGCAGGKRGRGAHVLPLDEGLVFSPPKSTASVALDDALKELAVFDPGKAQVVERGGDALPLGG